MTDLESARTAVTFQGVVALCQLGDHPGVRRQLEGRIRTVHLVFGQRVFIAHRGTAKLKYRAHFEPGLGAVHPEFIATLVNLVGDTDGDGV